MERGDVNAIWKWTIGLLVAVPLGAYALGSLAAADPDPAKRAPLFIEVTDTATPAPLRSPSSTPTRDGEDQRGRDEGDDDPGQSAPSTPVPQTSPPPTPRTTSPTPSGPGSVSPTRDREDETRGPGGGSDDDGPETVSPEPDDLDDPDDDLGRDDDSSGPGPGDDDEADDD